MLRREKALGIWKWECGSGKRKKMGGWEGWGECGSRKRKKVRRWDGEKVRG
jgi:hypothetical protein